MILRVFIKKIPNRVYKR